MEVVQDGWCRENDMTQARCYDAIVIPGCYDRDIRSHDGAIEVVQGGWCRENDMTQARCYDAIVIPGCDDRDIRGHGGAMKRETIHNVGYDAMMMSRRYDKAWRIWPNCYKRRRR